MMTSTRAWRWAVCSVVAAAVYATLVRASAFAQAGASRPDPELVCAVSRPTAALFNSLNLWVAVDPPDRSYSYVWAVTRGEVIGTGSAVTWKLNNGSPALGIDSASVVVRKRGRTIGRCAARIALVPPPDTRGTEDLYARAFLARDSVERLGYGRYSYVLFGHPPHRNEESLYEEVVAEYTTSMPAIEELDAALARADPSARGRLNATYLVVDTSLSSQQTKNPKDILARYDYSRARLLLSRLPGEHAAGPSLVALAQPLTRNPAVTHRYVVYDLSRVPPELVVPWVHLFLHDAAQEHFEGNWSAERSALRIRTLLANVGRGVVDVNHSVSEWRRIFASWVETKP